LLFWSVISIGREVSPSGLEDRCWRIGKRRGVVWRPASGGLRTPAGKCRPPGLKTDAGASGKMRVGGGARVRWLTHTDREVSPSGLEDRCWRIGEEERWWWRLGSGGLRTPAGKCRPPGLKTDASASGRKRGGGGARVRWLTHTGREVSPSGLKTDADASGKEEGWWWRPGPVAYAHRQRSVALRA
jgi:hypothetical protein